MRNTPLHVNEESAILTGQRQGRIWYGRLRRWRAGQPASVDFDWAWVLEREERRGDILGFYHTHPAGLITPSSRDVRTMQAWVTCLGKPLLCVIESGPSLVAYIFETDEAEGRLLAETHRFTRNVVVGVDEEKGQT